MPPKFFYGWVIVTASFVILTVAYGVQFSYGVFLPHIMADLGLSRVQATAPFSLYVLVYTVMGLVSGTATDRLGPRVVVLAGAGLLGLGYCLLATASSQWQIFLFLSLIAGIGMSAVFVPVNATVVRWFTRRRGAALGISGTGVNAALLFGPLLAAAAIPWLGWRMVLLLLGLAGAAMIAACALVLVRDPEARNLVPDGMPPGAPNDTDADNDVDTDAVQKHAVGEVSWTLRQAVSTGAFWIITGVYVLTWIMLFFPFVHLPILAAERGHDATTAASLVAAMGLGGIVGRLLFGWLGDRVGRRHSLHLALFVQVAAFLLFTVSGSLAYLYFAAALYIAGSSSATSLYPAVIADHFGRGHIGAITGVSFAIAGAATAIGPLLAGWIRDTTGTYQTAFLIGAALNIAAILLLVLLRPPQPD
jgi:OFA family oxalate/formate antiporter-like MFS transporter